jgi:WD repeat-containing protein 35
VTDISWDGAGLRVAIAAGTNIFCAAIRPNYKWCYLANGTLVFAFQKSDRVEFCVVFWDTKSDEKFMKYVRDLAEIRGQGEFCAIFTKNDLDLVQIDLCNSIGTIIESKQLALEPTIFAMSRTHIVACSEYYIYMWQYRSQTSRLTMFEPSAQAAGYRKLGREICWFIESKPDLSSLYDAEKFDNTKESQDPICGAAINEQLLIVGLESGVLRRFTLPHITE